MRVMILFLFVSVGLLNGSSLPESYLSAYGHIAKAEMQRTGIPASIKMAQGMLESDFGRSTIASKANNHFGIKCGSSWNGKGFYRKDDDYNRKGELMKSCFRVFDSAEESFIAHSEFIRDPKKSYRYGKLFELPKGDYKAWAYGLKKAGYATDKKYPQKLIQIIEKHQLHKLDEEVLRLSDYTSRHDEDESKEGSPSSSSVKDKIVPPPRYQLDESDNVDAIHTSGDKRVTIEVMNNSRYVLPKKMELAEDLAKRVGISIDNILHYNDHILYPGDELAFNVPVYLEEKQRDYKGMVWKHRVKRGQSLEIISQMYGVRVETLRSLNRIRKSEEPKLGERINLREKVSKRKKPKCRKKKKQIYIF